jgi:hypothetical protein
MKYFFLSLPVFLFLCISCGDYVGYDFEGLQATRIIKISGNVYNYFTGEPIREARISIGHLNAITGLKGDFKVYFPFSTDENRDKPIPVHVEAYNYASYSGEFILYPKDPRLEIYLEYLAPVIQKKVLVKTNDPDGNEIFVCQARILDYQGFADLTKVESKFRYFKDRWSDWIFFDLKFVEQCDSISGYFQSMAPPYITLNEPTTIIDAAFNGRCEIRAWDKAGHEGLGLLDYFVSPPDTFLFPPRYD